MAVSKTSFGPAGKLPNVLCSTEGRGSMLRLVQASAWAKFRTARGACRRRRQDRTVDCGPFVSHEIMCGPFTRKVQIRPDQGLKLETNLLEKEVCDPCKMCWQQLSKRSKCVPSCLTGLLMIVLSKGF